MSKQGTGGKESRTMKAEERMRPKVRSCEAACLGFARPASIVCSSLLLFRTRRSCHKKLRVVPRGNRTIGSFARGDKARGGWLEGCVESFRGE